MSTVVFAPDSFKGTIAAVDAARALARGWRTVDPGVRAVLRPMADGGEGTLDAFAGAIDGARRIPVTVSAPAPGLAPVDTAWLLLPPAADAPHGTAVVELASTAGIELFGARLDPWRASTAGFGETIAAALASGVSRLVLAIGSSASTDGGAGMLRALGARLHIGERLAEHVAAADLGALTAVDLDGLPPLPEAGALVLSDVSNPLLGPLGAAAVFGPQKGFRLDEIAAVDAALAHFAALVPRGDAAHAGAGAAGGTGFALTAWGATLVAGAATVADLVGLAPAIAASDLVVTGEGRLDAQTAQGKAPAHVRMLAAAAGVPAAVVAGRIPPDADVSDWVAALSLTQLAGSSIAASAEPERWLHEAGAELARRHAASR